MLGRGAAASGSAAAKPAYNSGDRATTRSIARQVIDAFEGYDAVVAPSVRAAA